MPTILTFHTHFWENSGQAQPPEDHGPPPRWNYPLWQGSHVQMVIWGVPGTVAASRRVIAAVRHWIAERRLDVQAWRIVRRLRTHPDGDAALALITAALESPVYPLAGFAVRKTATTLGFNRPEAWLELSRAIKRDPGSAENQYRHMEAVRILRVNALQQPIGNPEANLLIELAYQIFALKGR